MALITVERARRAFAPRAWTDADNAELAQAVGTASELAQRFCGSTLGPAEIAEIHDPAHGREVACRHRPARALLSAFTDPAPAMAIGRDRAGTVRLSTTELILVDGAGGRTLSLTTFPTATALAAAINAGSDGYAATVAAGATTAASAQLHLEGGDLHLSTPARGTRPGRPVPLLVFGAPLVGARLDVRTQRVDLGRRPGAPVRLVLEVGHDPVPEPVAEAVAQMAAALYWSARGNPATGEPLPHAGARALLNPFRQYRI
ncbi:MAG: hypothetical protein ACOYNP_10370 [Gemmataceae bacterium]|jgi:hypothetical protein